MTTLIVMTGLLAIMFAPVFNSYNSPEAKKIVEIEKSIEPITKDIKKLSDNLVKIKKDKVLSEEEKIQLPNQSKAKSKYWN